jgi:hypothetical protein
MFIKTKHRQIIHFENKTKSVIDGVIEVRECNMVHLLTDDGLEYIINPDKVNFVICTPIMNKTNKL